MIIWRESRKWKCWKIKRTKHPTSSKYAYLLEPAAAAGCVRAVHTRHGGMLEIFRGEVSAHYAWIVRNPVKQRRFCSTVQTVTPGTKHPLLVVVVLVALVLRFGRVVRQMRRCCHQPPPRCLQGFGAGYIRGSAQAVQLLKRFFSSRNFPVEIDFPENQHHVAHEHETCSLGMLGFYYSFIITESAHTHKKYCSFGRRVMHQLKKALLIARRNREEWNQKEK